ncbi:MAG: pilus assembly protein N-terminal domain-containing protein [Gemmataceae bacterium]|nr:pilus assembly protein N-terminal domain-containing protein [Gemmataceae bacterium]
MRLSPVLVALALGGCAAAMPVAAVNTALTAGDFADDPPVIASANTVVPPAQVQPAAAGPVVVNQQPPALPPHLEPARMEMPRIELVQVEPVQAEPVQAELPQPKPLPKPKETNPFIDKTVEPTLTLDLTVGLSKILVFKTAPKRIQLDGDEKTGVASHTVITEKEISLLGRQPGQTVLTLWFDDPKEGTKIYSYLVRVSPDPRVQVQVREQLEKYYRQVEKEINRAFPNSRVSLSIVGTKLLVCGQAYDIHEAAQILRIVNPRAGAQAQSPLAGATVVQRGLFRDVIQKSPDQEPDMLAKAEDLREIMPGSPIRGIQVVNMLRVPGEQQVALKVLVAEVNRNALRSMGINFTINAGNSVLVNRTATLLPSTQGPSTGATQGPNILASFDAGRVALAIEALKTRGLARTLSEPTLVALNGESADFRAGGSFPVPEIYAGGGDAVQGASYVPFGVQLQFTPVITDKDRIRLTLKGQFSVINDDLSANVNGTNVRGLNERAFQTAVDLRSGETMAIAGLISKNYQANSTRVPFLGDIPIIGRVFGGRDSAAADEQELIVLITPVLTRPLDPHHTRPVPGSDMLEPSDAEFYIHGRLESHQPVDYRSPVRTDWHRMQQYRQEIAPLQNPQALPGAAPVNTHPFPSRRGHAP